VAKAKKRVGRPLLSRELIGYDTEMGNLQKLRRICIGDARLKTKDYVAISNAISLIEKRLRSVSAPTPKEEEQT